MLNCCEKCAYYRYDEEFEEYYCSVTLDEDEAEKILSNTAEHCKYFNPYDEYKIVQKQN